MKGTWKNGTCTSFPKFFKVNGTTISDKNEIADGFNNFFLNIGPTLANNIVPPSGDESIFAYMKGLLQIPCFYLTQIN